MKTLIKKSIQIYGMGHPEVKTVFQLNEIAPLPEDATEEQKTEVKKQEAENEQIKNDIRFKSLTTISGRKLTAWFKVEGEDKEMSVQMVIPKSENEEEIKSFILTAINNSLK